MPSLLTRLIMVMDGSDFWLRGGRGGGRMMEQETWSRVSVPMARTRQSNNKLRDDDMAQDASARYLARHKVRRQGVGA